MKQGSTLFLKAVIVLLGLAVLAVCVFFLPLAIRAELAGDFDYGPILLGMYVTAVPFLFALYQALTLLGSIDKNEAFSESSVHILKYIKYCVLSISALYTLGMPYIFYVADQDDAPGIAAVAFIIIGAGLVVATATAVLQKLLQNAIDIKKENDMTV